MDDVLIATSATLTPPIGGPRRSDLFATHDLFVKPEKCVWEAPRVDYLGLILKGG